MQIVEVTGNVTKGEGLWLPYIMGTRSLTSSNEVTQFHLYCVINRVAVFLNFVVEKSRLASVTSKLPCLLIEVKGRLLVINNMLKLGLKNPLFHLPKNFIVLICSRNIAYSGEYSLVYESHVLGCFFSGRLSHKFCTLNSL